MSHYTIVVPVKSTTDIWSFLHPYTNELWIACYFSIPIVIVVMCLLNYHVVIDWETIVSFVIRAAMVDGRYPFKRIDSKGNKSLKLLGIIWIWACFILIQSYDGNLTAMFARPTMEKTIRNVEELLNQNAITWALDDNGVEIVEYLKASPNGSNMRRLFDQAEIFRPEGTDGEFYSPCYTIEQRDAGTYASICYDKGIKDLKSRDFSDTGRCNYYTTEEKFFTTPAVMALQVEFTDKN